MEVDVEAAEGVRWTVTVYVNDGELAIMKMQMIVGKWNGGSIPVPSFSSIRRAVLDQASLQGERGWSYIVAARATMGRPGRGGLTPLEHAMVAKWRVNMIQAGQTTDDLVAAGLFTSRLAASSAFNRAVKAGMLTSGHTPSLTPLAERTLRGNVA